MSHRAGRQTASVQRYGYLVGKQAGAWAVRFAGLLTVASG